MKLEEFDYNLPEELIAQVPIQQRDESRLMVVDREKRTIEDKVFRDIIDYLEPGDCLVRNNTKVIPARLYGKKDTGANVEFVLLKQLDGDIWESIVRPGNKLKPGSKVIFGDGLLKAEILLWNMGTGLKEKWRRAAQDESGLDVIITVALIAVMLIVAGLVVKLLGRVLEPTGTSVGNFLSGRV